MEVEMIPIHLVKNGGEQHTSDYKDVNPMGQVPALEIDGLNNIWFLMENPPIVLMQELLSHSLLPSLSSSMTLIQAQVFFPRIQ